MSGILSSGSALEGRNHLFGFVSLLVNPISFAARNTVARLMPSFSCCLYQLELHIVPCFKVAPKECHRKGQLAIRPPPLAFFSLCLSITSSALISVASSHSTLAVFNSLLSPVKLQPPRCGT